MAAASLTNLTQLWESGCTSTRATEVVTTSILKGAMQLPQQRFWLLTLVTMSIRHACMGAKAR